MVNDQATPGHRVTGQILHPGAYYRGVGSGERQRNRRLESRGLRSADIGNGRRHRGTSRTQELEGGSVHGCGIDSLAEHRIHRGANSDSGSPEAGLTEVTVGAVASVPVVNDQLKSAVIALPLESLTPLAPPFTVAV